MDTSNWTSTRVARGADLYGSQNAKNRDVTIDGINKAAEKVGKNVMDVIRQLQDDGVNTGTYDLATLKTLIMATLKIK